MILQFEHIKTSFEQGYASNVRGEYFCSLNPGPEQAIFLRFNDQKKFLKGSDNFSSFVRPIFFNAYSIFDQQI